MNVWRRQTLSDNPYQRTAFRIARVSPESVRHRDVLQRISQMRKVLRAVPGSHIINGEAVTEAELASAERILSDPKQRILEELLEHPFESPAGDAVRKLADQVRLTMAGAETGALPVVNLGPLTSWATVWLRQMVERQPLADPSFGALELEPIPPFGRSEKE